MTLGDWIQTYQDHIENTFGDVDHIAFFSGNMFQNADSVEFGRAEIGTMCDSTEVGTTIPISNAVNEWSFDATAGGLYLADSDVARYAAHGALDLCAYDGCCYL